MVYKFYQIIDLWFDLFQDISNRVSPRRKQGMQSRPSEKFICFRAPEAHAKNNECQYNRG